MKADRSIAALSGLGIILVVIGHSTAASPEVAVAYATSSVAYAAFLRVIDWIYTFHMALFFAIAGFLYCASTLKRSRPDYDALILSKGRRLLVPYFVISTLAYPIKASLSQFAVHPVDFSFQGYFGGLLFPWTNSIIFFWFLPTLFLCFAVAPILLRDRGARPLDVVVLTGAVVCWACFRHEHRSGALAFLNIGGFLHNFVFFCAGFMVAKYGATLSTKHSRVVLVGWLAMSLAGFALSKMFPLLGLPQALVGILLCMQVVAVSPPRIAAALANVGDHSFQIYLLSWFPLIGCRMVFHDVLAWNIWVCVCLSLLSGLLVPILFTRSVVRFLPQRARPIVGLT